MEDKELDQLLKDALSTDFLPDSKLNTKILQTVRENDMKNVRSIRKLPMVAAIFVAVLFCSVTAYAAWKYLSPKDVAKESGNNKLAEAFESGDAISMEESQTYQDYTVTLLGALSGENLTEYCSDGQAVEGRTYAVVAISKTDGTKMPDTTDAEYGNIQFFISPLIQGLKPFQYNIMTMNGGYFEVVKDGILYRMIECDNIELFADRSIYLCVMDTPFYNVDAYNFDEKTGEISVNENYTGMNLLFNLPLDKAKADPEAADKYLEQFGLE